MDTDEPASAWAAPWPAVLLGAVGTLGLAAWAVAASDPPGRLLVGVAALAVGVVTVMGAVARPRLAVDHDGLTLRGLTGTRRWAWERVDAVRVVRMRRLGVPAAYLEVEARDAPGDADAAGDAVGGRLLVLGRLELGTDPFEVADALQAHRARAGRRAVDSGPSPRPGSGERQRPDGDEHDEQRGDPADGEDPGGRA